MKKLSGALATKKIGPERSMRRVLKLFAGSAFSGLLLLACPRSTDAAPQPRSPSSQLRLLAAEEPGAYKVINGTTVTLGSVRERETAYLVYRPGDINPVLRVQGPAKIDILFYPIVSKPLFRGDTPGEQRIAYSVDGTEAIHNATTKLSNLRALSFKMSDALGIGTPIQLSFVVQEGSHTFSIIAPNGFFRITNVSAIAPVAEQPKAPRSPASKPLEPASRPAHAQGPPTSQPRTYKTAASPQLPFGGLTLSRQVFRRLGERDASGEILEAGIFFHKRLSDRLKLLLGLDTSRYAISMQGTDAATSLSVYTIDTKAGILFSRGAHCWFVALSAGFRRSLAEIVPIEEDVITSSDPVINAGFGAEAGYGYSDKIRISVEGSNNSLEIGRIDMNGMLPFGWVRKRKPSLSVQARLMHALSELPSSEDRFAASLRELAILSRITGSVPLARAGPVVISALAGTNITAGSRNSATPFSGGTVSVDLGRIIIEGGAAATIERSTALEFLLNMRLR